MKLWILLAVCGPWLAAATHEIHPDRHSRAFSAHKQPVLRIHSGDTVITSTWDRAAKIRPESGACSSLMFIRRPEIH